MTGLSPLAQWTQASAWVGGGSQDDRAWLRDESKPFIGYVEDRRGRSKTADARGISPAEALSQFIRGKAPLLGAAGAGAMAASPLLDQLFGSPPPQPQT